MIIGMINKPGISNDEIMLLLSLTVVMSYALWTILKRDWRN